MYRGSAQEEGERLGLCGWVRNLPTGQVEAEVEGPAEAVDSFIAWCRRGPPLARVTDVAVEKKPHAGDLRGFRITW